MKHITHNIKNTRAKNVGKKLILIIAFCISSTYTATAQLECRTADTTGTAETAATTEPNNFWCTELANYYPVGDNVVTVYANFIFLKPSSGVGKFDNVTQADCQRLLDSLNYYYNHIQDPTFPSPYNLSFLGRAKIKFILKNNPNYVVNDYQYHHLNGDTTPPSYVSPNFDKYAVNFIYGTNTVSCSGYARGYAKGNRVYRVKCPAEGVNLFDSGEAHLILHEVGHIFGLSHTNLYAPPFYTYTTGLNPTGTVTSGYDVNDYWLEDTNQFNYRGNHVGHNFPNNVMGYNWSHRGYLTPKQIGRMHTALRRDTAKYAVQSYSATNNMLNGFYYVFSGMNLTITEEPDVDGIVVESGGQLTINAPCMRIHKEGKIIVESGGKLTITNSKITSDLSGTWKGIIVEPGGKLSINNSTLTSDFGGSWQGIEVWGSSCQDYVSASGTPSNSGMVVLNNALITNAEIGVLIGKRSNSGAQILSTSGGGIIYSQNSKYINNKTGVQFAPYSFNPPPGSQAFPCYMYYDNLSSFKRDTFIVDDDYQFSAPPLSLVKLDRVQSIDFIGCFFKNTKKMLSTGIRGTNSSINMKTYCSSLVGSTCFGAVTKNQFVGCVYGISLSNSNAYNFPSKIDNVIFDQNSIYGTTEVYEQRSKGAVYISNNTGSQITNCTFKISDGYENSSGTATYMPYGLYLDNCTAYTVENNLFDGGYTSSWFESRRAGLIVHNSGTDVNKIYNNTFKHCTQALWAQDMNYNPNTGQGLLLQCNDFNENAYAIGVQGTEVIQLCQNCPVSYHWAGISAVQGYTNGASNILNDANNMAYYVRNYYGTQYTCFNGYHENNYYINTPANAFAINAHGSFNHALYHPLPQTDDCGSNAAEIMLQYGSPNVPSLKWAYCTENNLPTFSSLVLNEQGTGVRGSIHDLLITYAPIDGGLKSHLLSLISNTAISEPDLKDSLMKPDFLSDEVLTAYFTRASASHDNLKEVFIKNAPVNPLVWAKVLAIGLTPEEQLNWNSLQFSGKLSPKNAIETKLTYARNELGLINNEKIRRFLNDSTGIQFDSLIAVYSRLDEMPWGAYKTADVLIAAHRFSEANAWMEAQLPDNISDNLHFKTIQAHIIGLASDTSYKETMQQDTAVFHYLTGVAESNNALLEGYAKALLADVYDYYCQELIYSPTEESGTGERLANADSQAETKQALKTESEALNIYPNPASNQLIIRSGREINNIRITVVNLTGAVLVNTACKSNCELDISSLQEGVYFVNIYQAEKFIGVKKLVVLR